jgi:hypothetical protein
MFNPLLEKLGKIREQRNAPNWVFTFAIAGILLNLSSTGTSAVLVAVFYSRSRDQRRLWGSHGRLD